MTYNDDFRQHIEAGTEDLELLKQNSLLSESSFLTFAKDRALDVVGVITGEPAEFHKRGWLGIDAKEGDETPRFPPVPGVPVAQDSPKIESPEVEIT